ncbi:hypothetical protein SAY86_011095 [Trapa natans]|uniref:Senescence regulator n=1 Tax=Trapa natans TaxID=22666 RepID=A0AAN7R2G3_TRANT|nr:hypothetical protein SAY86_011095 [Trapa natans]
MFSSYSYAFPLATAFPSPLEAMDLELQESDVVFSSDVPTTRELDAAVINSRKGSGMSRKPTPSNNCNKKKAAVRTVPVDIPCNFFHHKRDPANRNTKTTRMTAGRNEFYELDNDDDSGEEMVPPHVIVGRRIAGKIAFSVCTGIGRTLKGRDLREVRNSILRLTGFLES